MLKDLLFKQGKRRCCTCRNIFPLVEEYFYISKRRWEHGFGYVCRPCTRKGWHRKLKLSHQVIKERNNACENCGIKNINPSFFDLDHIVSRKQLGISRNHTIKSNEKSNIKVLCPNCHRLKTMRGWKVKSL